SGRGSRVRQIRRETVEGKGAGGGAADRPRAVRNGGSRGLRRSRGGDGKRVGPGGSAGIVGRETNSLHHGLETPERRLLEGPEGHVERRARRGRDRLRGGDAAASARCPIAAPGAGVPAGGFASAAVAGSSA